MPGIRVVAIGAAQQATRDEQHDPQPRTVITRGRLVGMDVSEGAFIVAAKLVLVRSAGRKTEMQVMPAAGREFAKLKHRALRRSELAVKSAADHILLLLARQPDEVHRVTRDPDREL